MNKHDAPPGYEAFVANPQKPCAGCFFDEASGLQLQPTGDSGCTMCDAASRVDQTEVIFLPIV